MFEISTVGAGATNPLTPAPAPTPAAGALAAPVSVGWVLAGLYVSMPALRWCANFLRACTRLSQSKQKNSSHSEQCTRASCEMSESHRGPVAFDAPAPAPAPAPPGASTAEANIGAGVEGAGSTLATDGTGVEAAAAVGGGCVGLAAGLVSPSWLARLVKVGVGGPWNSTRSGDMGAIGDGGCGEGEAMEPNRGAPAAAAAGVGEPAVIAPACAVFGSPHSRHWLARNACATKVEHAGGMVDAGWLRENGVRAVVTTSGKHG